MCVQEPCVYLLSPPSVVIGNSLFIMDAGRRPGPGLRRLEGSQTDKSIADSLEGTVVWEYDPMECPQTIVKLYKGMMKAYVNQTSTYEGSTVVVEHQDKDQAAGLEVAESFILCGHQAFRTHIKNIAVFVHKDDRMEVAQIPSQGTDTRE